MWPLDVGLVILGSLVGYTIVSQLSFDDPRPLYNAWTYVAIVPAGVILLSLVSRVVASRFIEKSAQLGFLASVFVHLVLLLMAVNVMVFGKYFPDAFTGSKPQEAKKPKTVPEYVFASPSQRPEPPDWSRPVDAETASKVEPLEQRLIPPVEKTAAKLEMPKQEIEQRELEKALMERRQAEEALPMPADSPGERSKAATRSEAASLAESSSQPSAAPVPAPEAEPTPAPDRPADISRRNPAASSVSVMTPTETTPDLSPRPEDRSAASRAARAQPADADRLPEIGAFGATRPSASASPRRTLPEAASASPPPASVAVARSEPSAERVLAPGDSPITRSRAAAGASLSDDNRVALEVTQSNIATTGPLRWPASASSGMPSVVAGDVLQPTSRRRSGPVGIPGLGDSGPAAAIAGIDRASPGGETREPGTGAGEASPTSDPAERLSRAEPRSRASGRAPAPTEVAPPGSAMQLDADLPPGIGGLADRPASRLGIAAPSDDPPPIGAVTMRPARRPKLDVGGPMVPAGSEVAAVETFRRRILRTRGSGTVTPAGPVGPETEEAIERGLKYLAAHQRPEGHWSLQGHGEPVLLQSDTAATGLALLSFQGAGYTHKQHQYAEVVSAGLQALLSMQQRDGNLYRSENPISDQNAALYSHGIAALALCEAFGMTGDESLRPAAQASIDYIVRTQHRQRGGWRYQPQVSSDTSVSGWMMMALKSGELAGLNVPESTYDGIDRWLEYAQAAPNRGDRYRYNPFAADTPAQRHGRDPTPSMTAVAMLMRMYSGWRRENTEMQRAADYLAAHPPAIGDSRRPQRDTYYWYYATQVMFHMGGEHWQNWNEQLKPILIDDQIKSGPLEGSWDPKGDVPDRWSVHAGRLYLTTMNLLSLEVYYRHLPIYEDTAR